MQGDTISVERVIDAPAAAVFALVADASKHHMIDGSGTVKGSTTTEPLSLGATFGMAMHMGVPYRMVNTVVEFEPERRIAWQTRMAGPLGALIGGRIWRYVLEPLEDGARTRVTETWDISQDKAAFVLKRSPVPAKTRQNMEATLARIAEIVSSP